MFIDDIVESLFSLAVGDINRFGQMSADRINRFVVNRSRNAVEMSRSAVVLRRPLSCGLGAELHRSLLQVQKVASPSSKHFSAACIQQARNNTSEK